LQILARIKQTITTAGDNPWQAIKRPRGFRPCASEHSGTMTQ